MDDINFLSLGKLVKKANNAVFIETEAKDIKRAITKLRLDGVTRLLTISGIDNGKEIEIIYHFDKDYQIINIKTKIPRTDSKIESITTIYSNAKLYEREIAEMLDVQIEGNRDPKNVFLSEDSPRAPLRKDKR
ncbi:MAG: NADH-quinone oxidoreductase subunit C [archaeon]